jgi:hypothetical protein
MCLAFAGVRRAPGRGSGGECETAHDRRAGSTSVSGLVVGRHEQVAQREALGVARESRSPAWLQCEIRLRVGGDDADQDLADDPATHVAEPVAAPAHGGFAQDVEPQRRLVPPPVVSQPELCFGQRYGSDVPGDRLARRQLRPEAALKVACRERPVGGIVPRLRGRSPSFSSSFAGSSRWYR